MEIPKNESSFTEVQRFVLMDYSLEQCKEAVELLQSRIRQLTNADYKSYMEKEIKDLGLSTRSYNVLLRENLRTIGDVISFGIQKVGLITGCGPLSAKEIREAVLIDMPNE